MTFVTLGRRILGSAHFAWDAHAKDHYVPGPTAGAPPPQPRRIGGRVIGDHRALRAVYHLIGSRLAARRPANSITVCRVSGARFVTVTRQILIPGTACKL